jgi:hypothetical protein
LPLPRIAASFYVVVTPASPSYQYKSEALVTDMKKRTAKHVMSTALAATLCSGTILADDGTGEKGFVPPPREMKKPPAPPRTASSSETVLACCCCPVTPMSRTEAKKPPQPPVLITKIKETEAGAAPKK